MRHTTPRLTLTVDEAGKLLGISRSSAYEAARSGDIPSVRLGGRLLVLRRRFVETFGLDDADIAAALDPGGPVGSTRMTGDAALGAAAENAPAAA